MTEPLCAPELQRPVPEERTGRAGSGWRYPLDPAGRDLRLDFLRGLCLFKMIFDHLWQTPVHRYNHWIGYVTAAEGFFLISGVVLGLVYRQRIERTGLRSASGLLIRRGVKLYLANLFLVVLFVVLELQGLIAARQFEAQWGEGLDVLDLLHFNQPYFLHVLTRYSVYLLLAPLALLALRKRATWLVLLVSGALWYWNWRAFGSVLIPGLEPGKYPFRIVSWQLPFFLGMVLGWHRERVARVWTAVPGWLRLAGSAAGVLAFMAVRWRIESGALAIPAGRLFELFGREQIGPLRIVNAVCMFALTFELTDRCWKPLAASAGRILVPFGQASLYVFLMHILLVLGANLFELHTLPPFAASPWALLGLELALIGVLWWMVAKRFLFRWVPR